MEADWSLLDPNLLSLVLKKVPLHQDYLHFNVICKSWHDVSKRQMDERILCQARSIPLLVLAPKEDGSEKERDLYDFAKKKTLNFRVSLPYNLRCVGSSHGWLLYNRKTCFTMRNPVIGGEPIHLPSVKLGIHEHLLEDTKKECFYSFHVVKAILSCDPLLYPNDYEVLVIYGIMCQLAIFRAGDWGWTPIENPTNLGIFSDVIYHEDAFYAIDHWLGVGKITVNTCAKRETQSVEKEHCMITKVVGSDDKFVRLYELVLVIPRLLPNDTEVSYPTYLVESSNKDLICALRIIRAGKAAKRMRRKRCSFGTSSFKVFHAIQVEPNLKQWVEIDTLGDDVLFLGDNHSMAINVNGIDGYKKNSIYYTDDWYTYLMSRSYAPSDVGVFHLKNQRLRCHYKSDSYYKYDVSLLKMPVPPPIWIVPSLQGCNMN